MASHRIVSQPSPVLSHGLGVYFHPCIFHVPLFHVSHFQSIHLSVCLRHQAVGGLSSLLRSQAAGNPTKSLSRHIYIYRKCHARDVMLAFNCPTAALSRAFENTLRSVLRASFCHASCAQCVTEVILQTSLVVV